VTQAEVSDPLVGWRSWDARRGEPGPVHGPRIDHPNGRKIVPWGAGLDGHAMDDLCYVPGGVLPPDGADVVITEGEKAADAVAVAGYYAIGTVCGAGSQPGSSVIALMARYRVTLSRDNDRGGELHMRRISEALERDTTLAALRWIDPPAGAPDGWDLADADVNERRALIQQARPIVTFGVRRPGLSDVTDVTDEPVDRASARRSALAACEETFASWLHVPDPRPLRLTLAAVVANRVKDDDPVWPLIVGSPGSGKTEIIGAISSQPDVYPAGTMTEPALLSGTAKKERSANAKGGLLREIGGFGIIVCKDFGSVLSMNRETRAQVIAALREIYDGSWTRHVGTDGGQTLSWQGKVGLIAGCTPAIDSHHAVMGSMGERFVLYRISTTDEDDRKQAQRALGRRGDRAMRKALADAVAPVLAGADMTFQDTSPDAATTEWLVDLSTLAVRCRSSVERDGYSRDIELVPGPEMPARLALVLWRLLRAARAIGVGAGEAYDLIAKVALDSMPALRHAVLDALPSDGSQKATTKVAEDLGYPTQTTRRALEDLAAHGVIERQSTGAGKSDEWALSDWTIARLSAIRQGVPEMSEGVENGVADGSLNARGDGALIHPLPMPADISGTVPDEGPVIDEGAVGTAAFGCPRLCPACRKFHAVGTTCRTTGEGSP
jgi:hypothetical protein